MNSRGKELCILAVAALILTMAHGCSINRMAANRLADALAGSGVVFASDNDPELVREAVPFSLKLMEGVLQETPKHRGLLLAAARGFTQYAYAFVQQDADEVESRDLAAARALRDRARTLYVRARDYGLRGLSVGRDGFGDALRARPKQAVRQVGRNDVALLYWTAASWGAAIALSKDNPEMVADAPIVEALIDRALELDEAFDMGAVHTFLITYEMTRKGAAGDPAERARRHFARARELAGDSSASPFVAFAEQVLVQTQNRAEFLSTLDRALAVDVNRYPGRRLENLVMQRRARWLQGHADDLFAE